METCIDQVPGNKKKKPLNTHNNILRTLKLEQYMTTRGKIRVKYERKLKHLKINTGVKIDKLYCLVLPSFLQEVILFITNDIIYFTSIDTGLCFSVIKCCNF